MAVKNASYARASRLVTAQPGSLDVGHDDSNRFRISVSPVRGGRRHCLVLQRTVGTDADSCKAVDAAADGSIRASQSLVDRRADDDSAWRHGAVHSHRDNE
jgi:hypothetical protein